MSPTSPPRPAFARDFPPHPGLDSLVEAFARGDYARVRAEAPQLASSSSPADPAEVRNAARLLLDRTRPDPLAVWLLALTGALLVAMTAYWAAHGKPPATNTPPPSPPIERVR
jgi:hypothetical protein